MNIERDPESGFPRGSIGDTSYRLGTDVRELLISGYTWDQIQRVLDGQISLVELYGSKPEGEPQGPARGRASEPSDPQGEVDPKP